MTQFRFTLMEPVLVLCQLSLQFLKFFQQKVINKRSFGRLILLNHAGFQVALPGFTFIP